MTAAVQALSDFIYGRILIVLLLGAGVYFTFRLRFIQFRHFGVMFRVLAGSRKAGREHISSFQALATSLAARVGTGNLAGVAIAITMGGPGAVFWMWIVALVGMATTFIESTLAQLYKVRGPGGGYRGGPAYYMHLGLGRRWMGVLFALALMTAFGLFFNSVQANTIAAAFQESFSVPAAWTGVGLVALAGAVIFGGLKAVARFAEIVVPFMAGGYLLLALYVVFTHIERVPGVLLLILESAFGLREAVAGGVAYSVQQAMINGVRRGLFSNEAGMGSAPNAAASADPQPPHPASQGYVQMLGVFVDTLVICTCTASIILLSGVYDPGSATTGIELTQQALSAEVGRWGGLFVAAAVFLFAFTSIVANYSYAESNLLFLSRNPKLLQGFRVGVLGLVLFGSLAQLPLVWALADVAMSLMALLNLTAILWLSRTALWAARDFDRQWDEGRKPQFRATATPSGGDLPAGIWESGAR